MKKYMSFAGQADGSHGQEDLCIVVDTSYSMDADDYLPTRLQAAQKAAAALLEVKRDQHPRDQVAIVRFSSSARELHELSTVGVHCRSLVQSLEKAKPDGSTDITAGLSLAGRILCKKVPLSLQGLRGWFSSLIAGPRPEVESDSSHSRILLLSDGCDTSGTDPVVVADSLKDQGVVIDVVGIGDPGRQHLDEEQLREIASKKPDGSPRYCFIDDTEGLVRTFETLARHIKVMGGQEE